MTSRCRDYIQKQCLLKPNTHVAEDVGVDEKVVRQIGRANAAQLQSSHAKKMKAPRIIGIDELELAGEMRAIFVDNETSWPFELLPNRLKIPVTHFLMHLDGRREVEVVTIDMWMPYKLAVQAAMPQAAIIVDKWHVVKMANDAMDSARRRYSTKNPGKRKALKARRTIFLKRPFMLTKRELLDLDGWLKNTPQLRGAYETKEAFMRIWKHQTRVSAEAALYEWRASIPRHLKRWFAEIVKTTKNWETEILNYFDHGRYTNAPTEARNRVVRAANRAGSGYLFENIRTRALFGKRPGRVKKERQAALLALKSCWSCRKPFTSAARAWAPSHIHSLLDDVPKLDPRMSLKWQRKQQEDSTYRRDSKARRELMMLCGGCHELFRSEDVVARAFTQ